MFAELPLSTNTLLVVKSAIGKVMMIASSCGWWILLASSSMNVMACSFVVLVLGDRPESWTFCTTFRYVFLDLEDCPVEVPPMMALPTFPSTSHLYDLVQGSFSTSLAWWDLLSAALNHSFVSCLWFLWKRQYLFLLRLLGSPFIFFVPLQGRIILDLHKHLFQWHV